MTPLDRQERLEQAEEEWIAKDVAALRAEYARGDITLDELEDGLDDVFGVNGGIGHARECMIDLPSGACTCPKAKAKPRCPRSHRPWRAWIRGREYCYACTEWDPKVVS
jgi:hypothetical protein